MDKYLIVTGEMRSGTTFLANLLNSQPGIHIASDYVRSPYIEARKLKIKDLASTLTEQHRNILRSNLVAEAMLMGYKSQWLKSTPFSSVIDLVKRTFDHLDEESTIGGSKITALSAGEIFQSLANGIRVIYILRDPRDVLISSKNRFSNYSFFRLLEQYSDRISKVLKIKHPDFILIKFEDLIQRDQQTLADLASFTGREAIVTDLEVLRIRQSKEFSDNSSFNDISKLFDTKAIDRWKSAIDDPEVQFATFFLKDLIRTLNYEEIAVDHGKITHLTGAYRKLRIKRRIRSLIKSLLPV